MIDRILLCGLLKLELPGHDVRLCDGGTLVFNAETYQSYDPLMGTLVSLDSVTEGVGDEAPAGTITFAPPDGVDVDDISNAGMQGSRLRLWIAEVDEVSGEIIGTPDQQLDAVIDVPFLKLGKGSRKVAMDFASFLERLFVIDRGNVLSGEYHRRIHPGERGCDNATAVSSTFAWGVASAPRGVSAGGGGVVGRFAEAIRNGM